MGSVIVDRPKLLIWSVHPTHHQSAFFAALRARGIDTVVHYYSRIEMHSARQRLGWESPPVLPDGERYVEPTRQAIEQCPDWRERIHIVPGYSTAFLLRLALTLSRHGIRWVHWGEPSRPTGSSLSAQIVKRFYYGLLVNRYALGALAIGDRARKDFAHLGVRQQRIRFLPYSIPQVELPPAPDSDRTYLGSLRFLFLGALCHRKAVDVLLHAFRDVLLQFPEATLELVGADESAGKYARLVHELQISNAVRITESVPASTVGTVLSRCDVFVLPSRFDGWGVVLNEAASAGKPLISTELTGAAHHLIIPGVNGYRVPTDDPRALAEAMLTYCRNPELLAIHGRRSREIFADFTPEQNARRLQEALQSLLSALTRRSSRA